MQYDLSPPFLLPSCPIPLARLLALWHPSSTRGYSASPTSQNRYYGDQYDRTAHASVSLYLNPSPPLALPHPSRSSVRSVVVAPHSTSSSPRTPHLATVFVGSTLLPDSVLSIIPIIPSRVHPSSWRALENAACQTVDGVDLSLFSQQRALYERRIRSGLSGYGSTSLKCSSFFLE